MRIWRKLNRAGAVLFKGAVYLLPDSEDHAELFGWLVSEVSDLGGESAIVKADRIESVGDDEIFSLFNRQREVDYQKSFRLLEDLRKKVRSVQKGSPLKEIKSILNAFSKCEKEYNQVLAIDFFDCPQGKELAQAIQRLRMEIDQLSRRVPGRSSDQIAVNRARDYKGRTWVTRPNPFVDRMSSAWLIRKFIDPRAVFSFSPEINEHSPVRDAVHFDMKDAAFSHVGDLCTFEVLLKSFDLKDKTLRKIAEIVHDLDIRDNKYRRDEASGLEAVLTGIRNSEGDDLEKLNKGMAIFELLYTSNRI